MTDTYIGHDVITTRAALANNGHATCPAKVTWVGGAGENGGTIVNLMVFPDGALAVPEGVAGVELFEYEEDGLARPTGSGAWPIQ